jgi:phosphoenolpyruvate carboxylase
LSDVIRRVEVFDFSLADMDIRQHRDRHLSALDELLAWARVTGPTGSDSAFSGLSTDERIHLLDTMLTTGPRLQLLPADMRWWRFSEETEEVLATFSVIAKLQAELGCRAIDTYIVSFTQDADDLLAVLLLAQTVDIFDIESNRSTLQVVPLFETRKDLDRAPEVMTRLWALPAYRRQLELWGQRQEIMIGYSDSGKDTGYVASSWALYRVQAELVRRADRHGVAVTFFHGRGGAIGRGGGPLQRAIRAQPADTVRGRLKVTEQGEVLFTRYANPGIAHRHLEQVVGAVADVTIAGSRGIPSAWRRLMDQMSDASASAYQELLETPGFLTYFDQGTPLRSIRRLRMASRPAARASGPLELETLRAIPWVFAWMQSRIGLPGWYGLGAALEIGANAVGGETLTAMYASWPFFRQLIDAAQISLGKADLDVGELYAALVPDAELRDRVWGKIRGEFQRTVVGVNSVIGQDRILDSWPVLQRSIELRNPYVDPMSFLQVAAIHAIRQLGDTDSSKAETIRLVIDRAVAGISAGLQNTG